VDVKETKMKTQDIRNMGLALQSVQEKILTQKDKEKALAKAARSAKPKDQVSLKPMPASLANKMAKDEALKGDQHKLDHDKDGDIDGKDFAMLRKKKKGEKSEVKPRQEPDTENGKGDAAMEKKESTRWPVYARIMEKKSHTAGATAPEEMDSKDSPTAKKMKKDHKPEIDDTESKSHQDAADAGRKGPGAKARPNDNMKGDKNIVNPVKGAVTSGTN
jgi:hypothetical protein